MSSNLESKKELVSEIKGKISKSKSIAFVNYAGTTVSENTAIRNNFRKSGAELKVYKNRLVLRALNELGITGADNYLQGTNAIAFGFEDEISPAKILVEAGKNSKFKIVFGILGNKIVSSEDVNSLATLPSKEILVAKLLGLLSAPATSLVSVLSAPARGLAVALNAIGEKINRLNKKGVIIVTYKRRINMDLNKIVEEIKTLTVVEVSELVKMLEKEFGVSAAAPVMVAGPAAGEAAPSAEEKTEFNVFLKEVGANKIAVIKAVREITGLGLSEAKAVVDNAPSTVKEKVSAEEAKTMEAKLKEAGATVELK